MTRNFLTATAVLALTACGKSSQYGDLGAYVDVAQSAARQSDRVDVEQLASWLIEERQDFVLIDLRAADDYAMGQIGDARNIPIAELMTADVLDSLPRDRRIVVYSNGSENGAKALVMLRLAGFDAQIVSGGYNAWHQRLLSPDISLEELDGESLLVSEQRAYACYFVGERSVATAERPAADVQFVPPVIEAEEEFELPPIEDEGC